MSEKLEALKASWLKDPCWDIEATEGFEEYAEELKAFRLAKEAEWKVKHEAERNELAARIGIPGNIALLDHLLMLERRIESLEKAEEDREFRENQ